MANYLDMEELLSTVASNLGYKFETLDNFEINGKSQDWNKTSIYVLNDTGQLNTDDSQEIAGHIQNDFNFTLLFAKNVSADDNQDQQNIVYNELKEATNAFMFNINKPNEKSLRVPTWNTNKGKVTNNHFLAVRVRFTFSTTCNR